MKIHLLKNFVTIYAFATIITFLPAKLNAQAWGLRNGYGSTTGTDRASSMALDALGNLYVTGSFTGSVDFGLGVITAVGNLDGFVAKFSPSGVCQWAIRFNGPGTAQDQGLGLATNGTSVYVGGVYQTSLSINGAAAITGYGGIDGFIFKLDAATGSTQWATIFGSGSTDAVQAMCIDGSGNAYATGYFSSNATYPTATFGSFTRTTQGGTGTDSYVARLDGTTGAITWVSTGGMPGYNDNVSNSGLAYVPGLDLVVMVGSMQAPSSGMTASYTTATPASSVSLTTLGGLDITVLELSASTGAFQNAVTVGGASNSNEEALAAAYDASSQRVVFTGYFNTSSLTFGSNPTINPIGSDDIFYAAYNPTTHSFTWSKSAGSTIQDRGQCITTNGIGSVFITGRYRNTLTAPTATTPLTVVSSRTSSADEIYLLGVNSQTGNAELLLSPQGDNTITTGDIGTALAAGSLGKTWLGGMFGGTVTFSPLTSLTTSGGTTADILLARYDLPVTLPLTLSSFAARRLKGDIELVWHTEAEIDNDHFEIERSMDGRSFSVIGNRIRQSARNSATYNYTDMSAAINLTGRLFYRLKIVSSTGQVTYSSVVVVNLDKDATLTVGVLSNPFIGSLHLNFNMPKEDNVLISITDMEGKKLSSNQIKIAGGSSSLQIPGTNSLRKGVYNLTVVYGDQQIVQRIVKQ